MGVEVGVGCWWRLLKSRLTLFTGRCNPIQTMPMENFFMCNTKITYNHTQEDSYKKQIQKNKKTKDRHRPLQIIGTNLLHNVLAAFLFLMSLIVAA